MKKIFKFLLLSFFAVILLSCDPPHNIYFINKTNSNIRVKFELDPKVKNNSLKRISTNDSIVFDIKKNEKAQIYFGIGTWDGNEIDELVKSIDNISIETNEIKTIYKTKNSMKRILENNKEGFWWKTRIEIDVE